MPDNIFNAKVHTITPVHIGSGRGDLVPNYDFVTEGNIIWVIDHEKMFEIVPDEVFNKMGFDAPIHKLLKPDQYKLCSKYSLNNLAGINRIVEQIKNSRHYPYIPGSSLKGAIRTALAYAMVKEGIADIQMKNIGDNPRTADNSIEAMLFGSDPNHDVMRALQVSDTEGVRLIALNSVSLYSVRDKAGDAALIPKEPRSEYTFPVEVIPEGIELSSSIKIDNQLFKEKNSHKLSFDSKKDWVLNFVKHCNDFAYAIISSELRFYDEYHVPRIKAFYERLSRHLQEINQEKQFLLQISWGTGWSSKTIGLALDDNIFNAVIDKFNLDKGRKSVFPKTRRIIERGNIPEMPLGWIRVDLSSDI